MNKRQFKKRVKQAIEEIPEFIKNIKKAIRNMSEEDFEKGLAELEEPHLIDMALRIRNGGEI